MTREEFTKAVAIQFACLYVFGTSYEHGTDGNVYPKKIRNIFEFLSSFIWGIKQKSISSGTGALRMKRMSPDVQKLWKLCSD